MSDLTKLKVREVADARAALLAKQGSRCAICKMEVKPQDAVLDHDHSTGAVRGVLHRSCNSLLGKVENNYKRYGVRNLAAFLAGVAIYLQTHLTNQTGWLHPTFKTDEEKRLARNEKARQARKRAKDSTD